MHTPPRAAGAQDERGVILWAVIGLVLVLAGLSLGLLWEGMAEGMSIQHRQGDVVALEICEMGIVQASLEIRALQDSGADGIGFVSGSYSGGEYIVTAVQRVDYPDRWTLSARGAYRNSVKRVEVGLRRRERSDWAEGLFAKDGLTIHGTTQTDGYDSRLGTWQSQAVNADAGGPYALGKGHIGSNTTLRLTGTSGTIRGNAIPGPLHEVDASGSPTIWGDTFPRRREIPVPDPLLADFEAALAVNDNAAIGGPGKGPYDQRTMALTGKGGETITLAGGTYFFSSLKLTGGATLEVTGPAVIYVTESFDTAGGTLINTGGVPKDLRVYAHPYPLPAGGNNPSPGVKFGGGAGSALAMYAPGMPIVVHGDGDVYGAIVGNTIDVLGDASFHYDVALGDWDRYAVVVLERLYWRDLTQKLR